MRELFGQQRKRLKLRKVVKRIQMAPSRKRKKKKILSPVTMLIMMLT